MNTFDFKSAVKENNGTNSEMKETGKKRWKNGELGFTNPAFNESDTEDNIVFEQSIRDNSGPSNSSRSWNKNSSRSWDRYVTVPPEEEDDTLRTEWINAFIGFFKLLVYFFTFILILFCGIVSMSSLLLMTSMAGSNRKIIFCSNNLDNIYRGKTYLAVYKYNDPETIGWIWCLIVVMIAPIILTLYRCVKFCLFKNYGKPKLKTFLTILTTETLSTIGLVLLLIMVLPDLDSSRGAMLSHTICLMPAILAFISRYYKDIDRNKRTLLSLDMLSIVLQIGCLIGWALVFQYLGHKHFWAVPVLLLFLSIGNWDNYLTIKKRKHLNKFLKFFNEIRKDLDNSRYFTYFLISIWKLILILLTVIIYLAISYRKDDNQMVYNLFDNFVEAFSKHRINITRASNTVNTNSPEIYSNPSNYLWVLLIQILSTLFCYLSAKFVCKIRIQIFSFAFPLTLVNPITIVIISLLCRLRLRAEYMCQLANILRLEYIYWNSSLELNDEIQAIDYIESVVWILSLISQIWVTLHVWRPKNERLAKTENLFSKPEYCCAFVDQSLILNRKIHIKKLKENKNKRKMSAEELEESIDSTVRIYLCATMWHENKEEMIQMLKSVFRMDCDQSARRQARDYLDAKEVDYYEIEIHVFFDDAFENENSERIVNSFVKQFIESMDESASSVHECQIRLKKPMLTSAPYGGRLVWTLPGQNKLYVHLKDKNLIRHKKRWSQVMYMYYLLGYRLRDMEKEKLDRVAENTFILALDGDINFQPKAVTLLVDLMKKHKNLGAACGRIHPIGSGPMVWYQKFEYAIGHWLQKATEHVIGCVLCSPGCFSLFRAKALMTENVMNKYTSKASEPFQYVQYDQGEDRWLCTLLLQQGWRIEYCAASDSYTHAPESFSEFYNQRRRWAPSTLFNIWDLLREYRRTVQINDNISILYIIYQFALMIGTVFSPGTIFLMIVGAMNTSFSLSSLLSLLYSGLPILIFIIVCFWAKNETQIKFSIVLSMGYALLMLAVIVNTIIEMVEKGVWQPTALFFVSLCLSFIIAAIIHPTEFACVLPILLYMLCIPSMYLLLTIYSMINLNVISWGTREVHSKLEQTEPNPKSEQNSFLKIFNPNKILNNEKTKLLSCICCSSNDDKEVLKEINEIKDQMKDFKTLIISESTKINPLMSENFSPTVVYRQHSYTSKLSDVDESNANTDEIYRRSKRTTFSEEVFEIYEENKPFWTKDKAFNSYIEKELDLEESQFWREMIDSYLLPLDVDPKHEQQIKFELKELRDKIMSAFGLLNSLFILLVLLLQMHKDIFELTFTIGTVEVKIDVIGLMLVIFFGIILLIQFLGMFWHRFNTFSLLLSVTNVLKSSKQSTNTQQLISENAVTIAKRLQKLNSDEFTNRRTIRHKRPETQTIEPMIAKPEFTELKDAFLKRCLSSENNFDGEDLLPKSRLTRGGKNVTIKTSDVRMVVQNTIRRKQRNP